MYPVYPENTYPSMYTDVYFYVCHVPKTDRIVSEKLGFNLIWGDLRKNRFRARMIPIHLTVYEDNW